MRVSDTSQAGGKKYGYNLTIANPEPSFELYVSPAAVTAAAGSAVPLTFYAIRHEGFTGEIKIEMPDAPPGFSLLGGTVPPDKNLVKAVMKSGRSSAQISFEAKGQAERKTLSTRVVPVDDWEQAFIWHHLLPTAAFNVTVVNTRVAGLTPQFELKSETPLTLGTSDKAVVVFSIPSTGEADLLNYRLLHGPDGLRLEQSAVGFDFLELTFIAEKPISESGSLIVEMLETRTVNRGGVREVQVSKGVLPPVEFLGTTKNNGL